jgi:predicted PhzF superfamily epimerase YddE/YHI9
MKIFIVDAFASQPFKGNPAGVCLVEGSPTPEWMQDVASEMNLSETAFVERSPDGLGLRWFTPTTEVPLCGHATLATAHILWEAGVLAGEEPARFRTLCGVLVARRQGPRIEIDLPASPTEAVAPPPELLQALQVQPRYVARTNDRGRGDFDYLLELGSEAEVRGVRPDFGRLRHIPAGVIVTARAAEGPWEIVSRYFASFWGIDEDPVTGAAHTSLVPHWSGRLGRTSFLAHQASSRGGVLDCRLQDDRVLLAGEAITVVKGTLFA